MAAAAAQESGILDTAPTLGFQFGWTREGAGMGEGLTLILIKLISHPLVWTSVMPLVCWVGIVLAPCSDFGGELGREG